MVVSNIKIIGAEEDPWAKHLRDDEASVVHQVLIVLQKKSSKHKSVRHLLQSVITMAKRLAILRKQISEIFSSDTFSAVEGLMALASRHSIPAEKMQLLVERIVFDVRLDAAKKAVDEYAKDSNMRMLKQLAEEEVDKGSAKNIVFIEALDRVVNPTKYSEEEGQDNA